MYISEVVNDIMLHARTLAIKWQHEYITPEHIVVAMCDKLIFKDAFEACGGEVELLKACLENYLVDNLETCEGIEPVESYALQKALILASHQVANSGKDEIDLQHLIAAIMELEESYAVYYILEQGVTLRDLLFELCHMDDQEEANINQLNDDEFNHDYDEIDGQEADEQDESCTGPVKGSWVKYTTHLNEVVAKNKEPLIGREDILKRTIQVLCRKHKNNPIHIGEPGVGKTAITYGLARLINEGKVPQPLKGAQIYGLDLGSVLAGTQYRGDFEKRLKKILEGIAKQNNPIIYIDEIHNIVGAGALGGGSLDASNLLKPYLTEGKIKFIGATTFEEYKKYLEKDKGLIRRFQTIEVKEPSIEETIKIIEGIRPYYESYHQVTYTAEAIKSAVTLSSQYINDRYLPDKAIDLIDEAGAYCTATKEEHVIKEIDTNVIEETLSHICHIPKQTMQKSEISTLASLEEKLKNQVFGQEKAIEEVVKAIKLSRSGLSDANKPVASLLFVGPTGVGKTEIAKCLAAEMGIKLVRFDMSEYTEKHTASKLIGSPPGYVGYEEGGLLTDAIRKEPYCVLLLDEIEKAHSDIFNILLQVMDYATLTDNQGRKADFRNVILIMTSNAGASRIGKNLVGFGDRVIKGEAINEEVKKVFTPEFRNRLSSMIAFNHLDDEMARCIVLKALKAFSIKLQERQISIEFSDACKTFIARKGISKEYGAREINRIIENKLKPILVDEILFGRLSKGGKCQVDVSEDGFKLMIE